MKWQDIVNITPELFNKMNKQEMKEAVQILASAGNKRIKRAQEQDFDSPSLQAVLKKGKFSTKDKSLNQLRNEFMRAKQFLQSKTGTLQAFNKFKKETIASLQSESGITITPDQFENFWRSYEQLKEGKSKVTTKKLKYLVLEEIVEKMKDPEAISVDDIVSQIKDQVDQMYKEAEKLTKQAEEQAKELQFWESFNVPAAQGSEDDLWNEIAKQKPAKRKSASNERKAKDRSAQKAARRKSRRKR